MTYVYQLRRVKLNGLIRHFTPQGDDTYEDATGGVDPNYSEDEPPRGARIKNTSEIREVDSDHQDNCFYCKDGGELLCCDVCPKTFHTYCLNPPMEDIPDGEWRCAWCAVSVLATATSDAMPLYASSFLGPTAGAQSGNGSVLAQPQRTGMGEFAGTSESPPKPRILQQMAQSLLLAVLVGAGSVDGGV